MARARGIRRPLAGHRPVTKAALPGGIQLPSGAQTSSLAPQIAALQQRTSQGTAGAVAMAEPLPRQMSDFIAAFGPGVPLVPAPLNTVRPDTGQQDPRRYAYPVSWNLSRDMQRHTPWSLLIQAADKVDIIRRCIEVRKDEQTQQDWDFTLTKRALEAAGANTPQEKAALREKYSAKIRELVEWWQTPDKTNGLEFETWLSMALEEHFVLDALAIYPRLTYGGDLASLEVLDGSTIKPLLDTRGNRPVAPAPAFQQWLYGFPRGEYTDLGPSDSWEGDAGSLVYAVKTARTRSPYGLSTVEQALASADLWMHRQQWMRSEYTEGTLPTTWLTVDQAAGNMTPEQLRAWETVLNEFYRGSASDRHGLHLLPGGVSPVDTQDVSERYKPDYDEFLVKLVISHFNVDPMEIGFAPKGGLGGKGFSEGQQDTKYRQAIKPTNTFLSNIINQISRRYLDMPPELTHQFLGMEQEDEASADEVAAARTSSGRSTFNEDRDRQGMPRYEGEWADKPFIVTAAGPVWLDDAYEKSQEPPQPVPAPLVPHVPGQPGARPPATPPQGDDEDQADEDDEADAVAEKAVGELVAFGRFLAKRGKLSRPFAFEHLDKAAGALLNETAVSDPDWAAELAGDIVKVGPKGYKHGWIYVGGPGLPDHNPRTGKKGTLAQSREVHEADLTPKGKDAYRTKRDAGMPHEDALSHARVVDQAHRQAQKPGNRDSVLQDDKGRKVTITAAEKADVKAAKLHPTVQMLYTANRFRGVSHERALEIARGAEPAKGRQKNTLRTTEQRELKDAGLGPVERGVYASNRSKGMSHDEALSRALGKEPVKSHVAVEGGTLHDRDALRQVLNETTKGLPEKLAPKAPVAIKKLDGGKLGQYSAVSQGISIHPEVVAERGTVQSRRKVERAESSGYDTPSGFDDELSRTVAHEFGHHLDFQLSRDDRDELFTEIGKQPGFTPRKPNESTASWFARNKAKVANLVGTYAATNDRELFAELWTEYAGRGKEARPLARIVGEYVTRKLGK